MATYQGNAFNGIRIQVDGHKFDGNTFTNCVLVYGGGPLHFVGNKLHSVQWEFIDAAARTVALLGSFYRSGQDGKAFIETLMATFGQQIDAPSSVAQAESQPA